MNSVAILICVFIAGSFGKIGDVKQPEIAVDFVWGSSDSGVSVEHILSIYNLLPYSNNSQQNLLKDIKVSISSSYSNALAPLAFYFPDQTNMRLEIAPGAYAEQRVVSFTNAPTNPNFRPQYSIRVVVSYLSSVLDKSTSQVLSWKPFIYSQSFNYVVGLGSADELNAAVFSKKDLVIESSMQVRGTETASLSTPSSSAVFTGTSGATVSNIFVIKNNSGTQLTGVTWSCTASDGSISFEYPTNRPYTISGTAGSNTKQSWMKIQAPNLGTFTATCTIQYVKSGVAGTAVEVRTIEVES